MVIISLLWEPLMLEEELIKDEHTCGTCCHYHNGECKLQSGECINSENKRYWREREANNISRQLQDPKG